MENWNTLSKRVATRIEDMIASRPDARLPSQRELSSLFGVSRTSVREALSLLEASGKLRTEPGRGSFWVRASTNTPQPADPNALRNMEGRQDLPSQKTYAKSEISRFRYLIEGQSGRLAAMRITDSEIASLNGI
jgi:GntR family transcriptional regulator, transcriptional repressor for pyruvate dehydrogenase complex